MGAVDGLSFLLLLVVGGAIYFLPTIVALLRYHPNFWALAILNLLLGWTLLGWVGALVWSLLSKPQQATDAQSQAIAEKYGVSAKYRKCPECAELVLKEAKKCKHCQSELEPVTE